MARAALNATLPDEDALRSFAHAAARLLVERRATHPGARAVRRRAGVGMELLDHRDYVAGDEIRHIDWRITARQRRPIVRRFEAETVSNWLILIDSSSSMATHGAAKWHAALNAAAAMSYALLEAGCRVAALSFGTTVHAEVPLGRGAPHYAAIMRRLCADAPPSSGERSRPGACARHLRENTSVFLVSDFLSEDGLLPGLTALLERCATLRAVQVHEHCDSKLDLEVEVELVDAETGARRRLRAGPRAWSAAAEERAQMTANLRTFCARSGIAFTDWDIAQPWQTALLSHLADARASC